MVIGVPTVPIDPVVDVRLTPKAVRVVAAFAVIFPFAEMFMAPAAPLPAVMLPSNNAPPVLLKPKVLFAPPAVPVMIVGLVVVNCLKLACVAETLPFVAFKITPASD